MADRYQINLRLDDLVQVRSLVVHGGGNGVYPAVLAILIGFVAPPRLFGV